MTDKVLAQSGPYFQFYRSATPTTTLAVVFSSRAARPPAFTFWKKFQGVPCNVIFLNCRVPGWYRTGVPGIDGGLRGLAREIEQFARETGSTRIVAFGSSMGAYGACLLGHFTEFDETLVFGLEPLLGVPGGRTDETRNRYLHIYPDLRQINWRKTTIFYGEMDLNDVMGASMVQEKNKASIICLPFAQHDTPEFLDRAGVLNEVIKRVINGSALNIEIKPERSPHTDKGLVSHLWELNDSYCVRDWQGLKKAVASKNKFSDSSLVVKYLLGMAEYKTGNTDTAITILNSLVEELPLFWEGWLTLSAALKRKGLIHEAISAGSNTLKLQPSRSIAHFQLSSAYESNDDLPNAFEHSRWAYRLNNSNASYRNKFLQLSNQLGYAPKFEALEQKYSYSVAAKEAASVFGDFQHFWRAFDVPPILMR